MRQQQQHRTVCKFCYRTTVPDGKCLRCINCGAVTGDRFSIMDVGDTVAPTMVPVESSPIWERHFGMGSIETAANLVVEHMWYYVGKWRMMFKDRQGVYDAAYFKPVRKARNAPPRRINTGGVEKPLISM